MASARFADRRARLAQSLDELAAAALIVTHLPNIRYLTGFSGSAAILILGRDGEATLITDSRYHNQSKEETDNLEIRLVVGTYEETLARFTRARSYRSLAYEEAHFRVSQLRLLESELSQDTGLFGARGLVEKLRVVKDDAEIRTLERAASGLGPTLESLRTTIRQGMSERSLAAELDYRLRRHGYEKTSFETIVASGPRAALPHGRPSDRRFEPGDLVIVDFGGVMEGYLSDITRTFSIGEPQRETARIYDVVAAAQQAAIRKIRPGIEAQEVDRAAREVIESADFGEFFAHGTGHGIGLEVHEAPWISPGRADRLEPGMVFTVEPGIYVPGKGGVRLEDDVLVTDNGCRLLSRKESELQDFSWVCYG
jgi:Xaa-Pro aminopeptidase